MDFSLSQMMQMQKSLYELNKAKWAPLEPEFGKDSILYMIEEIGEVISILKKKGSGAIINDSDVRSAFLEEMADVLMYYSDVLLRFQITPEELSDAYIKKHIRNCGRDFTKEYEELHFNG